MYAIYVFYLINNVCIFTLLLSNTESNNWGWAGRGGEGAAGVRAHATPRPARHRPGGRGQGQLPASSRQHRGRGRNHLLGRDPGAEAVQEPRLRCGQQEEEDGFERQLVQPCVL